MSDLLNKASLVMVPSGYKEDTVYSVVPSDGSGDLAFTRASNGTRVNSSGLVEVVPWNLAEYSEQFDNGVWYKTNLSVSANSATAPNGTATADSLTTQTTGQCNLIQYLAYNVGVYTMSIYVKKVDTPFIYVEMGSSFVWFNLTTGANSGGSQYSSHWAFVSATSENVGNGWFKFQMVAQCLTAGTYGFRPLQPVNSSGNYTPSAINEVTYLWGAQLNIGSTAKPYFPTTDRLNVPRLTYQNGGGGCPSLLLEKQSTNLVTYSEQFDNVVWAFGGLTITANTATSPDGTQNADTLTDTATNAEHVISQTLSITSNATYTSSFFLKQGTNRYAMLRHYGGPDNEYYCVVVDLQSGTITKTQAGTSTSNTNSTIQSMGNGWYRVTATASFPSSTLYAMVHMVNSANPNIGIYGQNVYNGSGTNTVYIWGAQAEASSYPTSYIPTTSSSATRVADACFKTGISSLIGQTEGTIFCDVDLFQNNEACVAFRIDDGSNNNAIHFYFDSSQLNAFMSVSGTTQASISDFSSSLGRKKIAIVYKQNDFAFYVNGSLIGTDTSASVPTCSVVRLNGTSSSSLASSYKINESVLFKTKLTNADCIALTTL